MLGSLRGKILGRTLPDQILLEIDGIGYRVTVGKLSMKNFYENFHEGSEVLVYVSHQVREDSETLYGFLEVKDRDAFELLLKVHKVGPSMSMEILDNFNLEQLQEIVMKKDLVSLTSISGVGKATAERLLTELKNKLNIDDTAYADKPSSNDVRQALLELGYTNLEIRNVIGELPNDLETPELLKQALNILSGK